MNATAIRWLALSASILSATAAGTEQKKAAPLKGITTPGVQIPFAALKADMEFEEAARLFGEMVTGVEFAEFLTLAAYDYLE